MRKILILTIMVVATLTVSAQSKWQYTFSLGGEYKSGNVNTFTFNNKGGVERNDSILALDANYAIVYGQKDHVEYDKSLTGNLTFDIWQYNRVSPFVSATYYNNKYKGFEYKLSFLAGAKYRLFYNQNYDYSISAAYVYEYVDYFTMTPGCRGEVVATAGDGTPFAVKGAAGHGKVFCVGLLNVEAIEDGNWALKESKDRLFGINAELAKAAVEYFSDVRLKSKDE